MKKIKFDSNTLVSIGVVVGTGLLGLLKMKDDSNKAEKEKEEMIQEIMDRLSKKECIDYFNLHWGSWCRGHNSHGNKGYSEGNAAN